jgi:hypothetical protein
VRPLTIGVSFFVRKDTTSIWSNGAGQNDVFLWALLRAAGHRVIAINGGDGDEPHAAMMMGGLGIEFARFGEVADQLDVLVEGSAQLGAECFAKVRANGGRGVSYKVGNAYVIDSERMIHGLAPGGIFNGSVFDEVWTTPQHERTCRSLWETCYRAPVRVLPHIWEPTFVDAAVAEFPNGLTFGYQPGAQAKRISVFEPNINIVKTCIIPMLAIEHAYRRAPAIIGDISITNALALKEHLTFRQFAGTLDIVRARSGDVSKCCFEARHNMPFWLSRHTDVVVSHHWENGLNYAYYDALYGGYPLVHNADLPEGVGYRYDGFDAAEAGNLLAAVCATHDAQHEAYRARADAFLQTVRATAPANVDAYQHALARLTGHA